MRRMITDAQASKLNQIDVDAINDVVDVIQVDSDGNVSIDNTLTVHNSIEMDDNDLNGVSNISATNWEIDSDGWLSNTDGTDLDLSSGESGGKTRLSLGSDGQMIVECHNNTSNKTLKLFISSSVTEALTADITYEFKADGIYLNNVKITN